MSLKKIESYELPSDDDLLRQSIDAIICESCYLNEQCSGFCIADKKWLNDLRKSMLKALKD